MPFRTIWQLVNDDIITSADSIKRVSRIWANCRQYGLMPIEGNKDFAV